MALTYRFALLPGAGLQQDYTVFVHFLGANGEMLWTDDHQPPLTTSQWTTRDPVEYTRTTFVPGDAHDAVVDVIVGLYSPATGERVKMDGAATSLREYRVGSLTLGSAPDAPVIAFSEGWYDVEGADEDSHAQWRWTGKTGAFTFKNPRRSSRLYLDLDQPVAALGADAVEIRVADKAVATYDLRAEGSHLHMLELSGEQLGADDIVRVTLVPDKTLVPITQPVLRSLDRRELGVRVFHAYLRPGS